MWKVKNTSTDRSKAMLHRKAPRLEMEPNIAGTRLFMNQSKVITDEQYEIDKVRLTELVNNGIVELVRVGEVITKQKPPIPAPIAPKAPPPPPPPPLVVAAPPPAIPEDLEPVDDNSYEEPPMAPPPMATPLMSPSLPSYKRGKGQRDKE